MSFILYSKNIDLSFVLQNRLEFAWTIVPIILTVVIVVPGLIIAYAREEFMRD